MERQRTGIHSMISKERNKVKELILHDFRTYFKALATKTILIGISKRIVK